MHHKYNLKKKVHLADFSIVRLMGSAIYANKFSITKAYNMKFKMED